MAFASGIAFASAFPRIQMPLVAAATAIIFSCASLFARRVAVVSSFTLLAALSSGIFSLASREACLSASALHAVAGSRPARAEIRGMIIKAPAWERLPEPDKGRSFRGSALLHLKELRTSAGWIPVREPVRLTILAGAPAAMTYGDRVWCRGTLRRISPACNPGQFDARLFWHRRCVDYALVVEGAGAVRILGQGRGVAFRRHMESLRERLKRHIQMGLPESPERVILLAMLLGYRERMDGELLGPFQRTNTMHILAISGLHVGFFYLALSRCLRLLRVPERTSALIAAPILACYAAVTGAAIPVLRATVMCLAFLAAPCVGRSGNSLNALGLAALILLAANPLQLFDTGFQLSFGAVIAISLGAGRIAACVHRVWPCAPLPGQLLVTRGELIRWWIARQAVALCAASIAAWLGLAVCIARAFHIITLLGLAGNMVVIPSGFAIVCLGCMAACAGFFCPAAAVVFNWINWAIAWLMLRSVRMCALIPWAALVVPAILCCAVLPSAFAPDRACLRVTCMDVDQGDAVLCEFPGGENLLVDCGPGGGADAGARVVGPLLESRGMAAIDGLLLTHPHDDHIGGVAAVVAKSRVKRLVLARGACGAPSYLKLLAGARARGATVHMAGRGDVIMCGMGARITVLNPPAAPHRGTRSDENNNSIALMVEYGGVRLLLAGDMEGEAEEELCGSGMDLHADILKVGHHGGGASCTREFLDRVAPRWAVVSVGARNRFGHPAAGTVARLRERGVAIFRTDLHGAVTIVTDGSRVSLNGYRGASVPSPQFF
ncbi:MAG: ComEC/Rec2 family competence protein [Candidatus Aureabacteria bacterium]|nr:ComEC/Rec2 family competence protein [Candidatus Auribacterota bacterium]